MKINNIERVTRQAQLLKTLKQFKPELNNENEYPSVDIQLTPNITITACCEILNNPFEKPKHLVDFDSCTIYYYVKGTEDYYTAEGCMIVEVIEELQNNFELVKKAKNDPNDCIDDVCEVCHKCNYHCVCDDSENDDTSDTSSDTSYDGSDIDKEEDEFSEEIPEDLAPAIHSQLIDDARQTIRESQSLTIAIDGPTYIYHFNKLRTYFNELDRKSDETICDSNEHIYVLVLKEVCDEMKRIQELHNDYNVRNTLLDEIREAIHGREERTALCMNIQEQKSMVHKELKKLFEIKSALEKQTELVSDAEFRNTLENLTNYEKHICSAIIHSPEMIQNVQNLSDKLMSLLYFLITYDDKNKLAQITEKYLL